jgi:diphosphomevalonate decarboxylase
VGIASSASAFAALTLALSDVFDWKGTREELSVLTRLAGSGSACRSIADGFTKWHKGSSSRTSFCESLYEPGYWDLRDIVVVVSADEKKVGSADGHRFAQTSPLFPSRLKELPRRIAAVEQALSEKNMALLGTTIEEEAISFHSVCMTSQPGIFYLNGHTLHVMQLLQAWRSEGVAGYFTMDAGPNTHVICEADQVDALCQRLTAVEGVKQLFINKPCRGAHLSTHHLV